MVTLAELRELRTYPPGGAAEWRARYEPRTASVVFHREVSSPRVSVVVVAYRTEKLLVGALDRVVAQRGVERDDIEVVLIDNGGIEAVRHELPSRVDLEIRMKDNAGLQVARNAGVAWARAPLVGFLDDDGWISPDYYRNALRYFDDRRVLAIRGRIVAKKHPLFTSLADHYDRGDRAIEDCLVTEGSSVVRRDAFLLAGGFPEGAVGHEGIDLCFRWTIVEPEGRVLYAPDVVMQHDFCDSWAKFVRKSRGYAGLGDRDANRHPELRAFVDRYRAKPLPRGHRSLPERAARRGLKVIRAAIELTAPSR